jgi:hypothetical protein
MSANMSCRALAHEIVYSCGGIELDKEQMASRVEMLRFPYFLRLPRTKVGQLF